MDKSRFSKISIACFLVILFGFIADSEAAQRVFIINKPIKELLSGVPLYAERASVPSRFKRIPVKITVVIFPADQYYKIHVKLLRSQRRVKGFNATLEFWGQKNRTIVRETVNLDLGRHRFPFRWINLIKAKIENIVEYIILHEVENKIK